jgi:HD-like signal output (HDOD) protein
MLATTIKSGSLVLNVKDIPAISALLADAIRVLDDTGASGAEIESVIMRDPALTTRILRVVNSAAYGFTRRIETVRESVVMLGSRKVRSIAGAMVSCELFARPVVDLLDPLALWSHSVAASAWATQIIEQQRAWHAQSAVLGALLHDIGAVLLGAYATEQYRVVLEKSRSEGIDHTLMEQNAWGTTHARIGAILCASWMLPVGLTALVNQHHSVEPPADGALGVLMLADWLASTQGYRGIAWSPDPVLPGGLLESLNMQLSDLDALLLHRDVITNRVEVLLDAAAIEVKS